MGGRTAIDRQQWLLIAAVMLPAVWSAAAAAVPAAPREIANIPPIASLAFDQYLVNLRNVGLRPILQGEFHFQNVGTGPLTITNLEPSCGCLSPTMAQNKWTYQPGEWGYFVVGVATANEAPGPHTYTVKVRYEDPHPRETVVRFKLTLPERKISIEPPELAFFQYSGTPSTKTVYLTDYRGGEIGVTDAAADVDFIGVDVKEAETDEQGHFRIPIVLHVPGVVPPGRTRTTLVIETTDAEFRKIRIPILVDGPSEVVPASAEVIGPLPPQIP